MATYNGEKYIRKQLDSIAQQALLPLELVITDDGSIDATLQIVGDFAKAAPFPVRIYHNGNRLGYADNFLKAASLCRGDLIAFCDQDDIWIESKLLVCSRFFADPNVVLTVHSAQIKTEDGVRNNFYLFYPRFKSTRLLGSPDPIVGHPGFAMVFRNSLFHLARPDGRPRSLNAHDRWIWFLAASAGYIVTIADALTLYRQHDSNNCGALQKTSITAKLQKMLGRSLDYDGAADFEVECSRILDLAAEGRSPYTARLKNSARHLKLRSKLHRLRAPIYMEDSTLWTRARAFLTVLFHAGYLPDDSKTRLGPQAAAKDLLFGVSGVFKRIS